MYDRWSPLGLQSTIIVNKRSPGKLQWVQIRLMRPTTWASVHHSLWPAEKPFSSALYFSTHIHTVPLHHSTFRGRTLGWIEPRGDKGCDYSFVSKIQCLQIRWALCNNGGPQRGEIIEPLTLVVSSTQPPSSLFSLSGLSAGRSTAYLTVPAWQHSCTTMSVPKVQKPLCGLVCVEKARRHRGRMEEIIWHKALA